MAEEKGVLGFRTSIVPADLQLAIKRQEVTGKTAEKIIRHGQAAETAGIPRDVVKNLGTGGVPPTVSGQAMAAKIARHGAENKLSFADSTKAVGEGAETGAGGGGGMHGKVLAFAREHGVDYAEALTALGSGDPISYIREIKSRRG